MLQTSEILQSADGLHYRGINNYSVSSDENLARLERSLFSIIIHQLLLDSEKTLVTRDYYLLFHSVYLRFPITYTGELDNPSHATVCACLADYSHCLSNDVRARTTHSTNSSVGSSFKSSVERASKDCKHISFISTPIYFLRQALYEYNNGSTPQTFSHIVLLPCFRWTFSVIE